MSNIINLDQSTIKQDLIDKLSAKETWASYIEYGVVDSLLDAISTKLAHIVDAVNVYANENTFDNCTELSSFLVNSQCLGYKLPLKNGATGTIRFSRLTTGKSIDIPQFTKLSYKNNYFYTAEKTTLIKNKLYVDVDVREGVMNTITFTAEGNEYETKEIDTVNFEGNIYSIYVNDILWTKTDSLFNSSNDDTNYEINIDYINNKTLIKFGNDCYGKKLTENDVVKIVYLETNGSDFELNTCNLDFTIEDTLYDYDENEVTLVAQNTTYINNGSDFPTLDEAKNDAKTLFHCGDRCSTRNDYITFIKNNCNDVNKINVWGINEIAEDLNVALLDVSSSITDVLIPKVNFTILSNSSTELSTSQISDLVDAITPYMEISSLLSYHSPILIPIEVEFKYSVKNDANKNDSLKTILSNLNAFELDNCDFNNSINEIDLQSTILEDSNLSSLDIIDFEILRSYKKQNITANESISFNIYEDCLTSNEDVYSCYLYDSSDTLLGTFTFTNNEGTWTNTCTLASVSNIEFSLPTFGDTENNFPIVTFTSSASYDNAYITGYNKKTFARRNVIYYLSDDNITID